MLVFAIALTAWVGLGAFLQRKEIRDSLDWHGWDGIALSLFAALFASLLWPLFVMHHPDPENPDSHNHGVDP